MNDLKESVLKMCREDLAWLYENIGNTLDYEVSEVNDDTPLEELPLLADDEDKPFQSILVKQRLEGKSVYDPNIQDALDEIYIRRNDQDDVKTDEYTQGKLEALSRVLRLLGCTEEADIALAWGTWNPLE